MAQTQVRDTDMKCPVCDTLLKELVRYESDGGITGGRDWIRQGNAYCPEGHKLDWTGMGGPTAL